MTKQKSKAKSWLKLTKVLLTTPTNGTKPAKMYNQLIHATAFTCNCPVFNGLGKYTGPYFIKLVPNLHIPNIQLLLTIKFTFICPHRC